MQKGKEAGAPVPVTDVDQGTGPPPSQEKLSPATNTKELGHMREGALLLN